MAELKEENEFFYSYETSVPQQEEIVEPLAPEVEISNTPQVVHPELTPHDFPQLKRGARLEKILYLGLAGVAVLMAFLVMSMGNRLTETKESTIKAQQESQVLKANIEQLTQEKSELSSAKKVKEVAAKKGLTLKEENVRNVK